MTEGKINMLVADYNEWEVTDEFKKL